MDLRAIILEQKASLASIGMIEGKVETLEKELLKRTRQVWMDGWMVTPYILAYVTYIHTYIH